MGGTQRTVVESCVDGQWLPEAVAGEPQPETCNGIDDDGGGRTDEDVVVPEAPNAGVRCTYDGLVVECWADGQTPTQRRSAAKRP